MHCNKAELFDPLVGANLQTWQYVEAERFGGFEVEDKLELGRRRDWQINRLGPGGRDRRRRRRG